jgi:hypothetical protein
MAGKHNADGKDEILSIERLLARQDGRTKKVRIEALDASIVVQKLPATVIEREDLAEMSPIVLALTEGVAEPKITEELIAAMTFEQANAIYEEVEKFNPGVIGSSDSSQEASAARRKSFPA